jgi:predicted ATPase
MGKGIGQSFHQQAHLGQLWILHRAGGFAQSRVTQLNDGSDGHGQFSMVCDRRLALAGFYLVESGESDLSCDGGVEQVEEFQLFFRGQE